MENDSTKIDFRVADFLASARLPWLLQLVV